MDESANFWLKSHLGLFVYSGSVTYWVFDFGLHLSFLIW